MPAQIRGAVGEKEKRKTVFDCSVEDGFNQRIERFDTCENNNLVFDMPTGRLLQFSSEPLTIFIDLRHFNELGAAKLGFEIAGET